jgi:hypothetical protein
MDFNEGHFFLEFLVKILYYLFQETCIYMNFIFAQSLFFIKFVEKMRVKF